jgi:hypothetical protein
MCAPNLLFSRRKLEKFTKPFTLKKVTDTTLRVIWEAFWRNAFQIT